MDNHIYHYQQAHFMKISDDMDNLYDTSDRNFILWYLLGDYRCKLSEMADNIGEAKTITDYASKRMMIDHMKAIEEIRDILQEEIF